MIYCFRYLCEVVVVDAIGRGRAVTLGLITVENSDRYKHVIRALRSLYDGGKTFVVDKCAAKFILRRK